MRDDPVRREAPALDQRLRGLKIGPRLGVGAGEDHLLVVQVVRVEKRGGR